MGSCDGGTTFPGVASWAVLDGRPREDRNGFVTALAVRACRLAGGPVPAEWLDVLESCRRGPAGFGFWPVASRPAWAPDLPADADDTAVMTLELVLAGRLDTARARSLVYRTVARHRVSQVRDPGPPWLRRGVFGTWHRTVGGTDLVDCTVNVNVLALLAGIGLPDLPGAAQSADMVAAAVRWAGTDRTRATSLSPFYPEPAELVAALQHAVAAGADRLGDTCRTAAAAPWATPSTADPDGYAVCSSPYGGVRWISPQLVRLRAARVPVQGVPHRRNPIDSAVGREHFRTHGCGAVDDDGDGAPLTP